ncbi:hypothetical protein GCM10018966_041390 [Streptomyces yanii]
MAGGRGSDVAVRVGGGPVVAFQAAVEGGRYWRSALVPEMRYSGTKPPQKPTWAGSSDFPAEGGVQDQAGAAELTLRASNYVRDEKRPAAGCGGP